MKHFLGHLLLAASLGLFFWQPSYSQPRYTVVDIGTNVVAQAINDSSQVVGEDGLTNHAFLWRNGVRTDLGTLGGPHSSAFGINDSGVVVGVSHTAGPSGHAFMYRNGVMTDIPTNGIAYAISDSNIVVGEFLVNDTTHHAFVYRSGTVSDLLGASGGSDCAAYGINDSNVIVGKFTFAPGITHPFIYRNGIMQDLGTLDGSSAVAKGINNRGVVVGFAGLANTTHAFMYRDGVMIDMGTLGPGEASACLAINDSGDAVGVSGNGAFIYHENVMTDLNTLIDPGSGWQMLIPLAINNQGEITGYSFQNGHFRSFLLRQLAITRPRPGEKWIAGDQDTIRWTGGQAGQFLEIELSVDSGITYTRIDFAVPADSGKYLWTVPDSLSTRAKIRLSDVSTSNPVAESDTFKVKGYVLTRFTPAGHYEAFNPNTHGWNYQNGTLWPQSWWSQFHYLTALDPNTNSSYPDFFHPIPDSTFVDWPLWVDVFSTHACYWTTFLGIYDGKAQQKWQRNGAIHNGSCFGFAASSFLAFSFKDQFLARHPGIPNFTSLFSLPISNTIRSTINGHYAFQFGKQSLDNDKIGQPKDPRTTLQDIRNMFITDAVDIKTVTIYNHAGPGGTPSGGAHTMAPIRIVKDNTGPSRYRLMLYDSNNPGSGNFYILIDSLNNTWTDFTGLGATWRGSNHFYLEIPVSNYLNTPIMGRGNTKPGNIKGSGNIEFYNTSKANIMYTASNGNRIGLVNGIVTNEIPDGVPIFNKNGRPSDPIGYYIPDDTYSIVLSNITDTTGKAYLTVFKEGTVYDYTRGNVSLSQVDRFNVNEGFSVASADPQEKHIDLKVIAELDSSERIFFVRNTQLGQNDSLHLRALDQSSLLLKNYGTSKSYDLEINQRSSNGQGVFEHQSITLQGNSSHTVVPDWNSLGQSPVVIWVDLGNNGTIDDTLTIANQATGVEEHPSLAIPKEYSLAQNYPNPFNPIATIEYALPSAGLVSLKVFDILGREVRTLVNEVQNAGFKSIRFDATGLTSGVYFYRLTSGTFSATRKLLLVK